MPTYLKDKKSHVYRIVSENYAAQCYGVLGVDDPYVLRNVIIVPYDQTVIVDSNLNVVETAKLKNLTKNDFFNLVAFNCSVSLLDKAVVMFNQLDLGFGFGDTNALSVKVLSELIRTETTLGNLTILNRLISYF